MLVEGQSAALGARAFDLLMCLIEHRDRVVTKNELMAQIWPGLVVEENNLTVQISALRKLLGPQAVATVPGRGYRFVMEVRERGEETLAATQSGATTGSPDPAPASTASTATSPARGEIPMPQPDRPSNSAPPFANASGTSKQVYFRRGLAAAALILTFAGLGTWKYLQPAAESESAAFQRATGIPLPNRPSIAVLPFKNMSGDAEQQYFSDGLTEDLITNLSHLPDVMVISHTSTNRYRDKSVDVRQIGKELGVRYVLEGSVRKSGDRMRITAQLIDATSGDHVWAESWDLPVSDFFALQDEITLSVVQKMEVRLAGQLHARKNGGTTNLRAYKLYYEGRKFHLKFTKEGFAESKKYFMQALELDPNYLRALVNLGWNYRNQAFFKYTEDPEKTWQEGMAIAKRVLERYPESGDPYALLAKLHNDKGDTVSSRKYIKIALQRDPNSVVFLGLAGLIFNDAGFPEEGLVVTEKAFRLSPFPPGWFYMPLSASYNHMARYEEALPPARECVKRLPENIECRFHLTIALAGAGQMEEAKAHAKEMLRIEPHSSFMKLHLKTQGSPEVKARLEGLLRKVGLLE
ncbi:MAG: winged helix-turn-helix domain-containing protein [Betaproteobacteria bacterium]|nr:winged helix-turn-helix domain-containing protein [Betaproteobacteria bacterium]